MTDAVAVALITGIPLIITSVGGFIVLVRRSQKVEAKVDVAVAKVADNTVITTQTRDMADGRLTEVTEKLHQGDATNARLIQESVAKAASDLLGKAQITGVDVIAQAKAEAVDTVKQAQAAAVALLEDARKTAENLLGAAVERRRPRRPSRRSNPRGRR